MNVSFIFRTFRSIFEFLATYETTFDPQKGQKKLKNRTKRSKNERNVLFTEQKMNAENETFFLKEQIRT